ncbi:SDR family oxidoreductase [Silvimonas sp.]|uniref:SDR family oxidoreductase n=1 Tax=Silvimonas sp. TaxID=2650811 RepID=UPI003867AD7E
MNRGGSVVFTTSFANIKGMPGHAAYAAAKAALRSFARTLAAEMLPREIRINAVSPGPIDTPIVGKVFTGKDEVAAIREKMVEMIPMKSLGKSEEIAKAVIFLAFDATFTTGAELPVDGGGLRSEGGTGLLQPQWSPVKGVGYVECQYNKSPNHVSAQVYAAVSAIGLLLLRYLFIAPTCVPAHPARRRTRRPAFSGKPRCPGFPHHVAPVSWGYA